MKVKNLYKEVAKELGISEDRVSFLYSSYWNFIKDTFKSLDIHDNMDKEDFSNMKAGFFIYGIGRMYCNYGAYKTCMNKKQNKLKKQNAEHKED